MMKLFARNVCVYAKHNMPNKCRPNQSRSFASKGKEKTLSSSDAVGDEEKTMMTVPVNILKDESDPVLKSISEYPEWVQMLHKKQIGLGELQRKDEKRTDDENTRYIKLMNRKFIKESNQSNWT